MSVKIDPVPYGTWTDEEFNQIVEEVENSIPDALQTLKALSQQQKNTLEKNLNEKRAMKRDIPPTDPYYHTITKRISQIKEKCFYVFQIQSKIENILISYYKYVHLHDIKHRRYKNPSNDEKYLVESETLLVTQIIDPETAALIECYLSSLPPWGQVGEILKFLRTRFLLLLHDAILRNNHMQEQEEDLILEILGDLSGIKEFYSLSK